MDYNNKWEFAIEAYEGSGGFDTGSYLDQHSRESNEKYAERQEITDYSNIFVQKVNRYNGYLFKTQPTRSSKSKLIQAIFDDADNTGNSIDVFMSNFAKPGKVRGCGIILVDMAKEIPSTLEEQIKQRAVPYFVSIKPEATFKYKLDRFKKFEFYSYYDQIDDSTFFDEKKTDVIRYYDKTDWIVFDRKGKVLDSGKHNLGVCPVLFMGENGNFPDIGEFTQVASIAKRHFNLESEMDDIMRGQTFNILTIQAESPSDVAITLSTDNAIKYGAKMERPGFIAPDVSPVDAYERKIKALENRIDDITYDLSTGLGAESGIALDIKFQGINGSLTNFAMRLEDLEQRMFDVACKYIRATNDVTIAYPDSFDITDLEKEIGTLDKVKRLGYTIKEYERTKLKQIVHNDLANVNPDQQVKIDAEIDDIFKEV